MDMDMVVMAMDMDMERERLMLLHIWKLISTSDCRLGNERWLFVEISGRIRMLFDDFTIIKKKKKKKTKSNRR